MINQGIKVFVTVVDKKSFTQAAELLHMTQPAVSSYIKKLEEELGVTLIDRSGRTIKLNPAGEIYYYYAKEMLSINERMQHLIQDLQNESRGPINIGASYTYGEYILPKKIAKLLNKHPAISPEVSISNSTSIIKMVKSHDLDIGIIEDEERATDKDLNITRLLKDRLYIIGNQNMPDDLNKQALEKATWIIREEGSGTRSYQNHLFASLDIHPKTITLSSTQAVKSSVANGIGLTLLSSHTIEEELKVGSLKIINKESTELNRYFHLLTPDVKFHSKSTRTLLELLNEDSIETHYFTS
ncbi:LysR substrate-binding domain-containing protein [Salinicoccus sp. HZC-1]|uniref:LysR substrate-binding domain-containing protein n=1 Tax=Salinicoccus sp. HZC-1 TaxID=3385497 RepID=UPI00398A9F00